MSDDNRAAAATGANETTGEKAGKAERAALRKKIEGAHAELENATRKAKEGEVRERTQAELDDYKRIQKFFTEIFGTGAVAKVFTSITAWIAGEEGEFDPLEFEAELNENAKKAARKGVDIDKYVVAHRALGYSREKENTPEALRTALEAGEQQVEIDVRRGKDNKLYVEHDPIDKEEDPAKKYMSFDQALEIIATCKNPKGREATMFFDVKDRGIISSIDDAIKAVDKKHSKDQGYLPIAGRHRIMSHDKKIMREAAESELKSPLIFYYFPSGKFSFAQNILQLLGADKVKTALRTVDRVTGGHSADNLESADLTIDGDLNPSASKEEKKTFQVFKDLPNKEIMDMVKQSDGYICVPAVLATPELVTKAHGAGVKVAVWGANDEAIEEMIFDLQVDLVISDTPKAVQHVPEAMAT